MNRLIVGGQLHPNKPIIEEPKIRKDERGMQTKTRHKRVPSGVRANIEQGEASFIHPNRSSRRGKTAPASQRMPGNGFLKTRLQAIPAYEAGYGLRFTSNEGELITDGTADHLIQTANNCLRLMGADRRLLSSGKLDRDCYVVNKALMEYLPEDTSLEFDFYEHRFSILLQSPYRDSFPDYTLFFFPVCGVDKMGDALAGAFKKFVAYLCQTQRIPFPYTHWDFSVLLEDWEPIDEDEEDVDEELMDSIIDYNEGHAHDVMQEIRGIVVSKEELLEALSTVDILECYDIDFVDAMIEGVELLGTDCITDYHCPDKFEFSRLFCLVWRNDRLVEAVEDNMNVDLQEVEDTRPYIHTFHNPESDILIQETTFPSDFATWWMKISNLLGRYE